MGDEWGQLRKGNSTWSTGIIIIYTERCQCLLSGLPGGFHFLGGIGYIWSGGTLLKIIICRKSGNLLGNIFFFWGGAGSSHFFFFWGGGELPPKQASRKP